MLEPHKSTDVHRGKYEMARGSLGRARCDNSLDLFLDNEIRILNYTRLFIDLKIPAR